MSETIGNVRDKVEEFRVRLSQAGVRYKTLDYDLSLIAIFNKDEAKWIVQQFRPERDGYSGMRIMADDIFNEMIEDYKVKNV